MVSLARKKFLRMVLFTVQTTSSSSSTTTTAATTALPALQEGLGSISWNADQEKSFNKTHRRRGIIYQIGSRVMYQTQNKTRLLYNTKSTLHKRHKHKEKLNVMNYLPELANDLIKHILTFLSFHEVTCVKSTQYKLYSMLNEEEWCNLYKRMVQNIAKKNTDKLWSFSNRRQTWRPMSGYGGQMTFQPSPGHLRHDGTLVMMQDLHQPFPSIHEEQDDTTTATTTTAAITPHDGINIIFTRIFQMKTNLLQNLLESIHEYNECMFGILRCRLNYRHRHDSNEDQTQNPPALTMHQISVLKHMVYYIDQRNRKHTQYNTCSASVQFNVPWINNHHKHNKDTTTTTTTAATTTQIQ